MRSKKLSKNFFKDVGPIKEVRHKWNEDRPGFAFVCFSSPALATKAVMTKHKEYLMDKWVRTDWAEEKKSSGGKGGGNRPPKNIALKDTTNRCWLGNLAREVHEQSLRDLFKDLGELQDVFIMGRDETRPQCAYISFADNDTASKAVADFQGAELAGYNIRIDWAEKRNNSGGGSRKREPS
eukprot:UN23090